jgi:hypothetical protein
MLARSGITCAWKRRPLPGQRHRARRAVEYPHADPRLEARHGPADAGRRQTQRFGRASEIACLGDRRQHADAGQDARIEAHEETPIVINDHHSIDLYALKSSLMSAYTDSNAASEALA